MGWSSGYRIFDVVAEEILEQDNCLTSYNKRLLIKLGKELQNLDWDTEYDSDYYDDPRFEEIWRYLEVIREDEYE